MPSWGQKTRQDQIAVTMLEDGNRRGQVLG